MGSGHQDRHHQKLGCGCPRLVSGNWIYSDFFERLARSGPSIVSSCCQRITSWPTGTYISFICLCVGLETYPLTCVTYPLSWPLGRENQWTGHGEQVCHRLWCAICKSNFIQPTLYIEQTINLKICLCLKVRNNRPLRYNGSYLSNLWSILTSECSL